MADKDQKDVPNAYPPNMTSDQPRSVAEPSRRQFPVAHTIPSVFRAAEEARKNQRPDGVAAAAKKFALCINNEPYLVDALIVMADYLAEKGNSPAPAVDAYRDAVNHSIAGTPMQQRALNGIVVHAKRLEIQSDRVSAYKYAALRAKHGTDLEIRAVDELVRQVEAQHDPYDRTDCLRDTANEARIGSYTEKRTAETFVTQTDKIDNLPLRVTVYNFAADRARAGSLLEKLTTDAFLRAADQLSDKADRYGPQSERISVLKHAFDTARPHGVFHQAVGTKLKALESANEPERPNGAETRDFITRFKGHDFTY